MRDKLRAFVESRLLSGHAIETDEDLLLSGLIDSLGVMRLVTFLESDFGVKVPARDLTLANFRSIDAVVVYLEARLAALGPGTRVAE